MTKAPSTVTELVGDEMVDAFRLMNPDMILDLAELAIWKDPALQQQKIEHLGSGTRMLFKVLGLVVEHEGDPYGRRYILTEKFQPVADAAKKIIDHLEIYKQIRRFVDS